MKIQPTKGPVRTWRPTDADDAILRQLLKKLGVDHTQIIRLGIRKLAESEGLKVPSPS